MLNAAGPHYARFVSFSRKVVQLAHTWKARAGEGTRFTGLEKSTRLLYRLCRYQRVSRTVGESSITSLLRDGSLGATHITRGTVTMNASVEQE